jgi:hypothetical protein
MNPPFPLRGQIPARVLSSQEKVLGVFTITVQTDQCEFRSLRHAPHRQVFPAEKAAMLITLGLPAASQEKVDRQRRRTLFDALFLAGLREAEDFNVSHTNSSRITNAPDLLLRS